MKGGRQAEEVNEGGKEKETEEINRGHMMEYRELFKAFCHR